MPLSDPWLPSGTVPVGRDAAPIAVYRYDPGGDTEFFLLDNVRCLSIERREGPDPTQARFRYAFSQTATDSEAPQSVEQALDTSFTGTKVIQPGDRLVVRAQRPDAEYEWLFDGYAVGFGMQLGSGAERVEIGALGIEVRARDLPLPGAVLRNAEDADAATGAGDDLGTDLPARFNPGGQPNCVGDDSWSTDSAGRDFPVFLDPALVRDPEVRAHWTVSGAARYLLTIGNDEALVHSPDYVDVDLALVGREPIVGEVFDPADPLTYDSVELIASDLPVTGKDWPSALRDLTGTRGFGMSWVLTDDPDDPDHPRTTLALWHPQTGTVRDLWLQTRGSTLDLTLTNLAEAALTRDLSATANRFVVQGAPERYEVSFVLAPAFPSSSSHAAASNLKTYNATAITPGTAAWDAYRTFVLDETGEGHYALTSTTLLTAIPSLDAIFGSGNYVHRRRRPLGELLTRDAALKPLRYRVAVSTDYAGTYPGPWDGTGTWQPVATPPPLLQDRVGVRIGVTNPNGWDVGKSEVSGHPFRTGMIKVVDCLGAPTGSGELKSFFLRLTVVVEADQVVEGAAEIRSGTTPLPWEVTRKVDARDRFRKEVIAAHSEFNNTGTAVTSRDDAAAAAAEAVALRDAADCGVLQGQATVPRLTTLYRVGDRVAGIQGRGLGFRTDGGVGTAVYPVVIGVRWELERGQRTILTLSDAAARGRS